MSTTITKFQRWLDLISYLVGRKLPVGVEELMERVPAYAAKWVDGDERTRASVRRTFERDKDELRKLGIPIETVKYRFHFGRDEIDGYVLSRRDFYLPYLRLVDQARPEGERRPYHLDEVVLQPEEVRAAADALQLIRDLPAFPFAREAASAMRKLSHDLGDALSPTSPVFFVDRPGAAEIRERLRPLSQALLSRKRVRFRYHGIHRGEATERTVHPYGLFFQHAHWYLAAFDLDRDAIRIFHVGRMERIEVNRTSPNTAGYEIPADFALDDHLRKDPWELGEEESVRAEVLFRFPSSIQVARGGHGVLVEEREGGATLRAFDVHQVGPFLRWILSFEGEAEIVSPPELRAELGALAGEIAALYDGEVA